MSNLVDRLIVGEHQLEASLRPERTLDVLRQCIDRGFIHVRFTETRGGTELGFTIDHATSDLMGLKTGGTSIKLVGCLTLDYTKVRCVALLDLASLSGKGHLELVG